MNEAELMCESQTFGNAKHDCQPLTFSQLDIGVDLMSESCLIIIHQYYKTILIIPKFSIDNSTIRERRFLEGLEHLTIESDGF
jgi:hypothetical protein